jgi:hypothetical protein
MIVSIHQPNFAPWLGYYQKIIQSDLFIFLDDVQYTKGGYQNRVCLASADGKEQWLTCPVQTKGKFQQSTRDVQFVNDNSWRNKHLKSLSARFHMSAHFKKLWPRLEALYSDETISFCSFNMRLIEWHLDVLGVSRKVRKSSDFKADGVSTQRLVQLVEEVGGSVYLSGSGGRNYLENSKFLEKNIKVKFSKFSGYKSSANRHYLNTSALDFIFFEDESEYDRFVNWCINDDLVD